MSSVDLWFIKRNVSSLPTPSKCIYSKILANYLSCNDLNLQFYHNLYGKPMLNNKNLFFNVSHTIDMMVVAVTKNCELGIDMESKARKSIDPLLLAKKFFHINEVELLSGADCLWSKFIQLWVIKEAFVKMKGVGINYGLNKFYVDVLSKTIFDVNQNHCGYNLLDIDNNYVCGIVPKFDEIRLINLEQIL